MDNIETNQGMNQENERNTRFEMARKELERRREAGEIEKHPYDKNLIWYDTQIHKPLTKTEVGNHVIEIEPEMFKNLEIIEFIAADGKDRVIKLTDENIDHEHPLIIFPEELGDEE